MLRGICDERIQTAALEHLDLSRALGRWARAHVREVNRRLRELRRGEDLLHHGVQLFDLRSEEALHLTRRGTIVEEEPVPMLDLDERLLELKRCGVARVRLLCERLQTTASSSGGTSGFAFDGAPGVSSVMARID